MNNFKKKAVAVAVGSALGLALTSAPAQAAPTYTNCGVSSCTLADLFFNSGSITMGNGVVFGGFSFASSSNAAFSSSVTVTGDDSDPLNVGLIFSGLSIVGGGNFSGGTGFLDYSFEVDNTNPSGQSFKDASLAMSSMNDNSNPTAEIFEDLFLADTITAVDTLHVYNNGGVQEFDSVVYAPVDSLYVDMFLATEDPGWIDGFSTYFSLELDDQPPPPSEAPEPGTLALLGAGLAGIGFSRRRKKQS